MKSPWIRSLALAAMLLGLGVATTAKADIVLTDQNATAAIDPDSSAGVYSWVVDGTSYLYQQWFWYRIGDTDGQHSIDTISAPTISQSTPDAVDITYANNLLSVEVQYILTGGSVGSFTSDIAEIIRITNLSGASLDLRFFQYSDFDLRGTPDDDSVTVTPNLATQSDNGTVLSESVVAPGASRYEADYFANTLNGLESGSPYNLNNNAAAGPGDVTWAYQWNRTLAAGGTFIISKDKHIQGVPEPSTLAIAGLGALGLIGYGIRRRKGA